MSDFVAVRTKLIAELEQVESVEFPVVSAWSAFGPKETGKPHRKRQSMLSVTYTAMQCTPHRPIASKQLVRQQMPLLTMLDIVDTVLSGRASLLQAWVEGTLSLASRHPLLLQFLQDDGTFTEETDTAAVTVPTSTRVSPEKEIVQEETVIAEYQCLRRCQIRADAAMDSEKVGVLDMGATVAVFEEKKLESGVHRVRFDQGWCSLTTADGTTVLVRRPGSNTSAGNDPVDGSLLTSSDSNATSSAVNNEGANYVASGEEQPANTGETIHSRGAMVTPAVFVSCSLAATLVITFANVARRANRWVAGIGWIVSAIVPVAVFYHHGQT